MEKGCFPLLKHSIGGGKGPRTPDLTCQDHAWPLPKYKLNSGLPSSTQAPVELYQGQSLIELSLYQAEFGGEIVSFVGKDFEITRNTAAISHVREARRVLRGGNQEFLLLTKLLGLAICDQGIGNIPECSLDGLFVAKQELLLPSFRQADV